MTFRRRRELRREVREGKKLVALTEGHTDLATVEKRGQALWEVGGALMELGRFEEAAEYYETADTILWRFEYLHGPAVVGASQRGLALMELGRLEEALDVFTSVIEKVGLRAATADLPDLITTAVEMRLALLERLGHIDEAGAAAEEVIDALQPGSTERKQALIGQALILRGAVARERGDNQKALAAFAKAIEFARRHGSGSFTAIQARAMTGQATVLVKVGRREEAISICNELVRGGADPAAAVESRFAAAVATQILEELRHESAVQDIPKAKPG